MASSRSVGVLTAFINADSAQLMKEFDKVERKLARWSSGWTKDGAKLALGFVGIENALKAVANEVRDVVDNIENIPGVPAEAVASVITLRDNLAAAKNWIDRMTASMVGFAAKFGQAVGVGFAGLMGYDDASGLGKQESPDDIARAKDPNFDSKVDAARRRLSEATKAASLAGQSDVEQIIALREEAERLQTYGQSKNHNSAENLEAQAKAQDKLKDASTKMAGLNKQLADSEKEVSKAMTGTYTATLSRADAIAGLENRSTEIFQERSDLNSDPNDPVAVQKRIDLNHELADVQERLGKLYDKNAQSAARFADTVASGFVDGIFSGQSFSETLKQIALDIAKAIIKQEILNALMAVMGSGGGGGGGGFWSTVAAFIGGSFADGGRPPVGKVSVVGEEGPELFVPDMAGRIIPNDALRSAVGTAGSGRGGDTYYIDATGADAGAIARLEGMIRTLHGSIERRAVAAVIDARRRGGTPAGMLA